MFGRGKSDNLKSFEKCVAELREAEAAPASMSVHTCWKLFHIKYGDLQSWRQSAEAQTEWLTFLDAMAKDHFDKEMKRKLPFGTAAGIYLTIFYFKAVARNEDAKAIDAMSAHMEKFNAMGSQAQIGPGSGQRSQLL